MYATNCKNKWKCLLYTCTCHLQTTVASPFSSCQYKMQIFYFPKANTKCYYLMFSLWWLIFGLYPAANELGLIYEYPSNKFHAGLCFIINNTLVYIFFPISWCSIIEILVITQNSPHNFVSTYTNRKEVLSQRTDIASYFQLFSYKNKILWDKKTQTNKTTKNPPL